MNDEYHKELGKVTRVFFGIEDHGILSFSIGFDFGDSHQGTGHYPCSWTPQGQTRPRGMLHGADLVCAMLDFFKVNTLDKIEDQVVYALRENPRGSIKGMERTAFDGGKRFVYSEWNKDCAQWEMYVREHHDPTTP